MAFNPASGWYFGRLNRKRGFDYPHQHSQVPNWMAKRVGKILSDRKGSALNDGLIDRSDSRVMTMMGNAMWINEN